MPPKSRTKSTTEKTAAAVYFLSLNEHFGNYGNGIGDNLLYSVPLGELTPDEAEIIELYGQSFKWAMDCGDPTVKKIIVDACKGNVIFTEDAKARWDIELDGNNSHSQSGFFGEIVSRTLTLFTHTIAEMSVGELSEALSRFKTDESEGADERKLTRYIMRCCIEVVEALRGNQPLPPDVKAVLLAIIDDALSASTTTTPPPLPEPPIESPPASVEPPQYEGVYNPRVGATETDKRRWYLKSREQWRNKNTLWADIAKEEGIAKSKNKIRADVYRYKKAHGLSD